MTDETPEDEHDPEVLMDDEAIKKMTDRQLLEFNTRLLLILYEKWDI